MNNNDTLKNNLDKETELRRYLEKFIGDSSIERIKELEAKEIELKILKVRYEEKEAELSNLRDSINERIKQAVKLKEKELTREREQALKYKQYNIESKKVKPLKQETERLTAEKKTLEEMYKSLSEDHNKIISILEDIMSMVSNIQQILNDNGTTEEVKKQVENIVRVYGKKPTKEQLVYECKEIHRMLSKGITQKEIASILYPGDKRGEVRVSERKRSKTWRELYNEQ